MSTYLVLMSGNPSSQIVSEGAFEMTRVLKKTKSPRRIDPSITDKETGGSKFKMTHSTRVFPHRCKKVR